MTEQLLTVFKVCLLVLLYLFFARVLYAVWSEVRSPKRNNTSTSGGFPHVSVGSASPSMQARAATAQPIMQTTPSRKAHVPETKSTRLARGQVSKMVVIEPRARKGASFVIGDELTIGRSDGCTVSITDDEFISQVHARAFVSDGQSFVEDLGSTNGSYHNGSRLTSAVVLQRGDRLQIGNTVLEAC